MRQLEKLGELLFVMVCYVFSLETFFLFFFFSHIISQTNSIDIKEGPYA